MPYATVNDLPGYVKKYPDKIQKMWLNVFNSVYTRILNSSNDSKQAEQRAFKAANGVVKKNMEAHSYDIYGSNAYMNYLVDKLVGNWNLEVK
jgi:cation transport regulator ChaB